MSVIALHLVFTGYGHWLPNDPRGSGSEDIRQQILEILGPVHHGRRRVQPAREVLRSFYRAATPLLKYETIWYDKSRRAAIGRKFEEEICARSYTCWACAVLRNHAHVSIRRHRDTDTVIWSNLAQASASALRKDPTIPPEHPIWADRPYAVFLETPEDIRRVINYIQQNPMKERLEYQSWDFVKPYDGWPFHKQAPRKGKPLR